MSVVCHAAAVDPKSFPSELNRSADLYYHIRNIIVSYGAREGSEITGRKKNTHTRARAAEKLAYRIRVCVCVCV